MTKRATPSEPTLTALVAVRPLKLSVDGRPVELQAGAAITPQMWRGLSRRQQVMLLADGRYVAPVFES